MAHRLDALSYGKIWDRRHLFREAVRLASCQAALIAFSAATTSTRTAVSALTPQLNPTEAARNRDSLDTSPVPSQKIDAASAAR